MQNCAEVSCPKQLCPSRDAIFLQYNRKGNFGAQCLLTTVAEITDSLQDTTETTLQMETCT